MIIDHITLVVGDFDKSRKFYQQALAPLGIAIVAEFDQVAGFGRANKGEFWLAAAAQPQPPLHIAFAAETREQVRRFYEAALSAGAEDNGAPGIRAVYHADYYAAFVIAPEGHNIEAVCHAPA
jgi:catechol 2,3-dioxygenase-like lactoylglutathione lyase family enzyme